MLKLKVRNGVIYVSGTYKGRRVRESTGLPAGMELIALRKVSEIVEAIDRGETRRIEKPEKVISFDRFSEAHASYLEHKPNLGRSSRYFADRCLARWGNVSLADISEREIKKWIEADLLPKGQWLARRTATQMSAILKHAVEAGMMAETPPVRRPREPTVVPYALSMEQREALLNAAFAVVPDAYPAMLFMAHTGARPIEMARLMDTHVMRGTKQAILRHRKGDGSWVERLVPLGLGALRAISMGNATGLVFTDSKRRRWDRQGEQMSDRFERRFEAARIAAKLDERATPYVLRHTFATLLLTRGVDIRTVQALMGHSTIEQTARYLALADSRLSSAVDCLTADTDSAGSP